MSTKCGPLNYNTKSHSWESDTTKEAHMANFKGPNRYYAKTSKFNDICIVFFSDVPEPPFNLTVEALDSTSVALTWKIHDKYTYTIQNLELTIHSIPEEEMSGDTITRKYNGLERSADMGGLTPSTQYQVHIVAIGANNRKSNTSEIITFRTLPGKVYWQQILCYYVKLFTSPFWPLVIFPHVRNYDKLDCYVDIDWSNVRAFRLSKYFVDTTRFWIINTTSGKPVLHSECLWHRDLHCVYVNLCRSGADLQLM